MEARRAAATSGSKQALEPKEEEVATHEEERAAALELLRDPRLLDRILADFERCGMVGEETNKLVSYLAVTSRLLESPLAILVQSSSAAGKSALMEAVLAFLPEEQQVQYSAMTGQSLFYMGETDLKHKVLAIVEEEGALRAAYALKLLQSRRRADHRLDRQGRDHRTAHHAPVPRRRSGDALPHHHGDRPGRRASESLPGADRGRGPRADAGDPPETTRGADTRRPAGPARHAKKCWRVHRNAQRLLKAACSW